MKALAPLAFALLLAACGAEGDPERPTPGPTISATAAPGIARDGG